jgi:hypothetical protein
MNKNKKGFLLGEETLKIVIAVICIGFLIYLLVSLYFSTKTSNDLELAKSSLNFLMSEINSGKTTADIYNPEGWQLGSWPHIAHSPISAGGVALRLGKQYPKTCLNLGWTSCICICPEDNEDSCDSDGICLNNPQNFNITGDFDGEGSIEVKDPPITLSIDQANKIISKYVSGVSSGGGGGSGGGGY